LEGKASWGKEKNDENLSAEMRHMVFDGVHGQFDRTILYPPTHAKDSTYGATFTRRGTIAPKRPGCGYTNTSAVFIH